MAYKLDKYDKEIIKYLQEDSSITNTELSKRIGLAPSSCLLRVKNLKEAGVILGYSALIDEKALGFGIICYASVVIYPLNRENSRVFLEAVGEIPEIVECYTVTGSAAYMLKIVAKDFQYYRDFVYDKLLSIPHVHDIKSSVVIGVEECKPITVE